uniref:Tyrosine aminotransferase n=1 Tax=Ciona intestinalis TaxID=7719 RepID=F6ZFW2_CIOIN|nr:tyrosine aminotransferase isoform X1 [Ciona intestinalis]|eukprot:XP_002120196.1 tyrosine aminotransferase isoform X1 [Ciona intestinalis]
MENHKESSASTGWKVKASQTSNNTFNPIRAIVDGMVITPNSDKEMIALSLGDPTVFGNFPPPDTAVQGLLDAVTSGKYNGYGPSYGHVEARAAVANHVTTDGAVVDKGDVYLSCGCSDALNMAITVLADRGDNILVPCPGFSLYKTLSISQGIDVKLYKCKPEKCWETDLDHMASLIDSRTKAIVVVNPSNPCGSNFSRQHICDIIKVAEEYRIPIIADEIYADIVFKNERFVSCASMSANVPILSCGGIAKKFLVPGWRLGWVVVHDRHGIFGTEIRMGLVKLSQRILGPCTLIQGALPAILSTPKSFHLETIRKLEENADYLFNQINGLPGLNPIKPTAAMYMMVGFDKQHYPEFKDDVAFTERLISEQSVFCLPAKCFEYPNYFRVVLSVPRNKTEEACARLKKFCDMHYHP